MRGEDDPARDGHLHPTGSPPHARGRPIRSLAAPGQIRITPACAGKTRLIEITKELESDHPRMRGEDPCSLPALLFV